MRRLLLIVTASACVGAPVDLRAEAPTTVAEMIERCRSAELAEALTCEVMVEMTARTSGVFAGPDAEVAACVPELEGDPRSWAEEVAPARRAARRERIVTPMIAWLEAHPEQMTQDWIRTVAIAALALWPCGIPGYPDS